MSISSIVMLENGAILKESSPNFGLVESKSPLEFIEKSAKILFLISVITIDAESP